MRILQVLTYISPDFAYGGPLRVALNQAKALRDDGQDVILAASAAGFGKVLPENFDNLPVKLFPARRLTPNGGFSSLVAPEMLKWIYRILPSIDVIHIHLARDMVTLPAALLTLRHRKPLVVQTHGMIKKSTRSLAKPLDILATRPVLESASAVLYLTEHERNQIASVAGDDLRFQYLPNGVPVPETLATEQLEGPCSQPEILSLGRLHPTKRPQLIIRAAETLAFDWPNVRFALVGPDEGEAVAIRAAINHMKHDGRVKWEGPLPPDKTSARMRQASIFALPSVSESFGMSAVEAMAVGLPVVVTDGCGLAPLIQESNAGIVCDQSEEEFISALRRLVEDATLRVEMGANGRKVVKEMYALRTVSRRLVDIYRQFSDAMGD